MLFSGKSPASDGSAASAEDLAAAGGTLAQLQGFFERHNFDTAGPYSDLFSVLLTCCKHLVDASLQHHVTLSAQQREIARLSSEKETLCDLTTRFQEALREVQQNADRISEPLASRLAELDAVCERIVAAESETGKLQRSVDGLRRRADAFEESEARMQSVQEDVRKLQRGIAAHAEYIDGEVSALREENKGRKVEKEEGGETDEKVRGDIAAVAEQMQQYADSRVEALRTELCAALRESIESHEPNNSSHASRIRSGRAAVTATARPLPNRGSSGNSFADGFRRLQVSAERMYRFENRLEALEVYAPHHCAMAARPPLLGIELHDDHNSGGVRVEKVYSGYAAEAVGFAPGDLVIAVNGQEIHTRAEIYAVMTEAAREHQAQCRLTAMSYYKRYNEAHGGVKRASERDGEWEMPLLVLSFHLKRGGLLREVTVTAESSEAMQQ